MDFLINDLKLDNKTDFADEVVVSTDRNGYRPASSSDKIPEN